MGERSETKGTLYLMGGALAAMIAPAGFMLAVPREFFLARPVTAACLAAFLAGTTAAILAVSAGLRKKIEAITGKTDVSRGERMIESSVLLLLAIMAFALLSLFDWPPHVIMAGEMVTVLAFFYVLAVACFFGGLAIEIAYIQAPGEIVKRFARAGKIVVLPAALVGEAPKTEEITWH